MSTANVPMTSSSTKLAVELIRCTSPTIQSQTEQARIAISQMRHRLNLLEAWFGSLEAAKSSLDGKTVLEIGCGQGDMTVVLAWAVGPAGIVNAIDPAPPDYGSPETLQEAQERISRSPLGVRVNWRRCEPIEALQKESKLRAADCIVLAHSLLYMKSTDYIATLFRALITAASISAESASPRLLVAEWGMRVSTESARAHLFAVQAQAAQPLRSGNVQLYVEPKTTMELALKAGWRRGEESWIESPDLDDGMWEVAATRSMLITDDTYPTTRDVVENLSRVESGSVRCMDVWTAVYSRS